jgi:hypothetical protein
MLTQADGTLQPDALTDELRRRQLLDRILTRMPEALRSVFVMFELEEFTSVEIASTLSTDTDTDPVTIVAQSVNGFTKFDACSAPVTTPTLVSGSFVTISSPQFSYNPSGHDMVVKITVCTDEDQAGMCITQELNFTP